MSSYPRAGSCCKVFGWLPLRAKNRLSASHWAPSLEVINSQISDPNQGIPRNDRVLSLIDNFLHDREPTWLRLNGGSRPSNPLPSFSSEGKATLPELTTPGKRFAAGVERRCTGVIGGCQRVHIALQAGSCPLQYGGDVDVSQQRGQHWPANQCGERGIGLRFSTDSNESFLYSY